jgi:hypothetical protein
MYKTEHEADPEPHSVSPVKLTSTKVEAHVSNLLSLL